MQYARLSVGIYHMLDIYSEERDVMEAFEPLNRCLDPHRQLRKRKRHIIIEWKLQLFHF